MSKDRLKDQPQEEPQDNPQDQPQEEATHTPESLLRDMQDRIERSDQRESDVVTRTRDELAEFKLEVARAYVPLSLIRDVDRRLSQHLLRIEEKLEEVKRCNLAPPRSRGVVGEDVS